MRPAERGIDRDIILAGASAVGWIDCRTRIAGEVRMALNTRIAGGLIPCKGQSRIAATNGETLAPILPQMTKQKCAGTKYA
jgi:hypothetical protein